MSTENQILVRDIDVLKTFALSSTLNFTRYSFKKKTGQRFIVGDHHRLICEKLDLVIAGKIKKLIINIAPRYSKTEIAVKNFISYGFAINPKSKFIHLSYSDDLVLDNSSEINTIVSSDYYQHLFDACPVSTNSRKWYTEQGGGLYAVSSSGQVTGFGAGTVDPEDHNNDEFEVNMDEFCPAHDSTFSGAIIIDDPIKPDDALSDVKREAVNNKFETTIRNRVNSRNTPIIVIMQRLHPHDLCGYLQEVEPNEWTILSLPCIYNDPATGEEKALWEHKHTITELRKIEAASSFVFHTQYQQNPQPQEGLMYESPFKEYDIIPAAVNKIRKNYTDTADTGTDYLCSIDYIETDTANFVLDILYTQKPMEYTEPKTAEMLTKDQIQEANIESNNGGRSFARAVEKQCRILGNNRTKIKWFHQSENKNVRIFTRSAEVQNLTYFPRGWQRMWPEFARAITTYMKTGNNAHDDGPDALTGTIEKRQKNSKQSLERLF